MHSTIIKRLANWRAHILHRLEAVLRPEDFKIVRPIILKSLGDNGLKGDIEAIFKSSGHKYSEELLREVFHADDVEELLRVLKSEAD